MSPYGQIRAMANTNIQEIRSGRVQWHRHEMERIQARRQRLERAGPGDILHHRREGDFVLRKRLKYTFRVEPYGGGPQRVLPHEDFMDATSTAEVVEPEQPEASPRLL